jgi:hypothetical protein
MSGWHGDSVWNQSLDLISLHLIMNLTSYVVCDIQRIELPTKHETYTAYVKAVEETF